MLQDNLRNRLFLSHITLALVILLSTLTILFMVMRQRMIEDAVDEMELLSELKRGGFYEWLSQGQDVVNLFGGVARTNWATHAADASGMGSSFRDLASEELLGEMKNMVDNFPHVLTLSLVDTQSGRIQMTTDPPLMGRLRAREDYYIEGQKGVHVSKVAYSVGREKPVLYVSGPVFGPDGDVGAVAVAEMDLEDLRTILQPVPEGMIKTRIYLVDIFGFQVVLPGGPIAVNGYQILDNEPVARLRDKQSGNVIYNSADGKRVLGVYKWLQKGQLGLVVEVDYSELTTPVRSFLKRSLFVALVLLLLAVTASVFLARTLTRPIREIAQTARELETGNLKSRAPLEGPEEIRRLASVINTMADSVERSHRDLASQVMERTGALRSANQKLKGEVEERKLAEEKLLRWNHIFQNLVVGVVTGRVDSSSMEMMNPAYAQMHGYTVEELTGREMEMVFAPHEREKLQQIVDLIPKEGQDAFEADHIRKDGTIFSAYHVASVTYDVDGKPIHRIVSVQDITDIRQAERERLKLEEQLQQARKMESLGILAGGIAHDFNNILMGITGHLSMAQTRMSPDSPASDNLKQASIAAQRAADLTNQMLAYSGKGHFVVKAVDLTSLLEEMIQLLTVAISKDVELELHLNKLLPSIKADPTQIRQVVMNLITNAVDAVGKNTGTVNIVTDLITLSADELQQYFFGDELSEGSYVFLQITDPGVGMDSKTVERIFDPFFSTKGTGRGLGLSAVMGIVKGHQGAIKVESEPGEGTTFRLIFPASESPADTASTEDTTIDGYSGNGTILVVDDDETVREIAGAILQQFGFDILMASDGREAVAIYGEKSSDIILVLMDITMPGMGGLEALPELRAIQDDVKVILSSGYTAEDTVTGAGEYPAADFIQKPYRSGDLIQAVKKVLEHTNDA